MFSLRMLSSMSQEEADKLPVIRLDFDPIKRGNLFGVITDLDGKKWSLNGCAYGRIMACPYYQTGGYYSTETNAPGYNITWKAHRFIVELKH